MSFPADIREEYDSVRKQATLLRCMRPYPGAAVPNTKLEGKKLAAWRLDFPTSALDALLVLIRALISFGYDAEDGTMEKKLIDLAWRDIGWIEEDDAVVKNEMLEILFPGSDFHDTTFAKTLHDILSSHDIISGEDFTIVSAKPTTMIKNQNGEWKKGQSLEVAVTEISVNGGENFQSCVNAISTKTDNNTTTYTTIQQPKFVRINLENSNDLAIPFTDLRTFEMSGLAVEGDGITSKCTKYLLLATIRKSKDEKKDSIRVYQNDVTEAEPLVVGDVELKEEVFLDEGRQWSVEDEGSFSLFYYRVEEEEDCWEDTELGDAREYEERAWMRSQE